MPLVSILQLQPERSADYSFTNVNFFKLNEVSALYKNVYTQVLQAILYRLGNNANTLIGDLDI